MFFAAGLEELGFPVGALALEFFDGRFGLHGAETADELVGVDGILC